MMRKRRRQRCLERIAVLERENDYWPPWELVAEPLIYAGRDLGFRFRPATLADFARAERPPDVPDTTPNWMLSAFPSATALYELQGPFRPCHCSGSESCETCRAESAA